MIETITFDVKGMTCASCVAHVEKTLLKQPHVVNATVNLATERAKVELDQAVDLQTLITAIEKAGFDATPIIPTSTTNINTATTLSLSSYDKELWAVIFSSLFSIPLMLPMFSSGLHFSAVLQLLLASIVQFIFGFKFYKGGWQALKAGTGNMDLLVALGTSTAYFLSLYLMLHHPEHTHLYFEASAMVITLVRLGKYLEQRAKKQTSAAIRALQSLQPDTVTLLINGSEQVGLLHSVKIGDEVIVKAGERIPVDGSLFSDIANIDESMLTGEHLPALKYKNEKVHSGTVNLDSRIIIKTTAIGGQTLLGKIIEQVETAQTIKPPVQKLADQISAVFVPAVILLAAITFAGWWAVNGNVEHALITAASVLVIACPCALGLATPAAIMAGTGVAAKNGILIRDPGSLEVAHRIKKIAFDKTGTLTEGKPLLTIIYPIQPKLSQESLLQLAASVQGASTHPISTALQNALQEQNLQALSAEQSKVLSGYGVQATIDRHEFLVGNMALMQQVGLNPLDQIQSKNLPDGATISWVADKTNQQILGWLAFEDTLKPEAYNTLQQLKHMQIEPIILTGDRKESAQKVGQQLGIKEIYAELLPHQKLEQIKKLQQQGVKIAMAGDGINDAPALAQSDLGIAMSNGTDIAMQTAQITIMGDQLYRVIDAIDLSKKTWRKIQQNLFWAFFYNAIGIPLAMLGVLNPMWAGAAMALSSISVLTNALLLTRWKSQTNALH